MIVAFAARRAGRRLPDRGRRLADPGHRRALDHRGHRLHRRAVAARLSRPGRRLRLRLLRRGRRAGHVLRADRHGHAGWRCRLACRSACSCTAILVVNNLRDIDTDRRGGQAHAGGAHRPARPRAGIVCRSCVAISYLVPPALWLVGPLTPLALPAAGDAAARRAAASVWWRSRTAGPPLNRGAQSARASCTCCSALLFAVGLLATSERCVSETSYVKHYDEHPDVDTLLSRPASGATRLPDWLSAQVARGPQRPAVFAPGVRLDLRRPAARGAALAGRLRARGRRAGRPVARAHGQRRGIRRGWSTR